MRSHAQNEIGVFAHEFGHAFGLPDLYDTSGRGEGLGNWCLMAGGAWGGDGQSPNQPVQMSAWAKELLGWVTPKDITADTLASISTIEDHADIYRITISPTQYYLIDNLGKKLSNSKLPTAGLQIFQVNQPVVNAGLRSNRVNYDPNNYGVDLIEADGLRKLHHPNFRGGPGDLFPGTTSNTKFDATTNPRYLASGAICQIVAPGDLARVHVLFTSNSCPLSPSPAQLPGSQNNSANITTPQQSAATDAKVSDILSNPGQYQSRVVQIIGRLENKGANIQLRKGRDFRLTDSSGSISVRLSMPLEIGMPRDGSDKIMLGDVLDETVRVLAIVETDSTTGRPRLLIKDAVILKN
ncbi:MAG: immune inhibitor A domain-containing protein [Pyrinomonadaceae bacterium]